MKVYPAESFLEDVLRYVKFSLVCDSLSLSECPKATNENAPLVE